MITKVILSKNAQKRLKRVPRQILVLFDLWIEIIETEGFTSMQIINGYRDHALIGERKGQRSSSLTRSWRVIYILNHTDEMIVIKVLEVNHHVY
jgi:mRNA-degrading endonuclease YafQ of YafQ-DinJ toxin-antitoxin module